MINYCINKEVGRIYWKHAARVGDPEDFDCLVRDCVQGLMNSKIEKPCNNQLKNKSYLLQVRFTCLMVFLIQLPKRPLEFFTFLNKINKKLFV